MPGGDGINDRIRVLLNDRVTHSTFYPKLFELIAQPPVTRGTDGTIEYALTLVHRTVASVVCTWSHGDRTSLKSWRETGIFSASIPVLIAAKRRG